MSLQFIQICLFQSVLGIMGAPTKKKVTKTKGRSENVKSMKKEEETAPYTATEETKEVDNKHHIEANLRGTNHIRISFWDLRILFLLQLIDNHIVYHITYIISGKKNSFVRSLSRTDFYSKGIGMIS